MAVQQTSLMSYSTLRTEQLGAKQQKVLTFVSAHPRCTDRDIMKGTGLTINCVCGRRNELSRLGFVKEVGTKGDDHVFIEEIRKLAHEIINWCDDCAIKRW